MFFVVRTLMCASTETDYQKTDWSEKVWQLAPVSSCPSGAVQVLKLRQWKPVLTSWRGRGLKMNDIQTWTEQLKCFSRALPKILHSSSSWSVLCCHLVDVFQMSRICDDLSWSTSRVLNEKIYIYYIRMECFHLFIASLQNNNNKNVSSPSWCICLSFSLTLSLSLTVFSLPRYFDVCVYITWRIKLHVSDHLSPYNNPQKVPVDINPWKNTAEVNFGDSPVAFGRINTESGIWR